MARSGQKKELSRSAILAICIGLSLAVHAGLVAVAPDEPPKPAPRPRRQIVRPVPVTVRRDLIKQIEEQAKPEPAPEPKPEPRPQPKKAPEQKPEQKPEPPKETPKPVQAKPVEQKPAEAPPAEPAKPRPFVLKNVALRGGVAVQTGSDSNLFGDPSQDAKGFKKGIDAPIASGGEGNAGAGGTGGGQQKEEVVIKQPKAINDVRGEYPAAFRDLRRVVRVELLLTIGADGNVRAVKIKKGAEQEFNDAAVKAANQLRFEPATRNGVPIAFNLKWTVVFIPEGT